MKNHFFIFMILLMFVGMKMSAQVTCYRIHFTDKNNSPYSVQRPDEFLSERAIAKRTRFQIPVTEADLPVNPNYVSAITDLDEDIYVFSKSKWTNTIAIYCPDNEVVTSIRNLPYVSAVEGIATYVFSKKLTQPNHDFTFTEENQSPVMNRTDSFHYGESIGQIAIHNGHRLHAAGFRGEGMLIAVLDAGWVNFNSISRFQPLYENGQIWGERDMLPTNNIYEGHEHGTYVTSIMASSIEDSLVGTAPAANYYLIRTENPWSEQPIEEDFWAAGAEIADSIGADVINSSLGYTTFDADTLFPMDFSTCDGETSIASMAATMAAERGIIVCVSAGNEGSNAWHYIGRPADAKDVLAVGAINEDSVYAPFSSVGTSYDGRVKPDIASVGWNTIVMSPGDSIIAGNGTSFASPVMAGLSACLWQALPQKNAVEVMQIIRESGHQWNLPDTLMGYGIPNLYQAFLDYYDPDTIRISDFAAPVNHYQLYPNPCQTEFYISNPAMNSIDIEICDMRGRVLSQQRTAVQNGLIAVPVSHLPRGLYLIRITDENGWSETYKQVLIAH